jgi:hypothetical protein
MTRTNRLAPPLLVALIALAACSLGMLPGVAYWDTGELQAVAPLLGTAHPTGFPTYVILGWFASVVLQPFGEPAFRINLFSAICLALAAGVTVDLVRALTGWLVLGIAAGIALALTPIAWAIGTHAEAHSLHLALVAILLWLLVAWETRVRDGDGFDRGDRFLVGASIVFGLAVGNHSLTLLLAIPVGLFVLAVDPGILRRGRLVLSCVAALGVTVLLVYLELPLRAAPGPLQAALVYGRPNTWDGFKYIVLAEQFQGSLSDPFGELPRKFGELVTRTVAQFGVLAPLIPLGLLVTAVRRPRYALLTGTAVAITCFFSASYINADINRYYLGPALMAWTWLAILAAAVVERLTGIAGGDAWTAEPVGASRPAPDLDRPATGTADVAHPEPDGDQPAFATADIAQPAPDGDRPATATADVARPEPDGDEPAFATADPAPPAPNGDQPAFATADPARPAEWSDESRDLNAARTRAGLTALLIAIALLVPTLVAGTGRYAAVDQRGQLDARVWTDHVLEVMQPNAVIVSWWSFSTPLWYAQRVEGRRPDITIVDDRTRLDENLGGLNDVIDANLGMRPVYVIRLDQRELTGLAQRYQLEYIDGADASALTHVVGRRTAGT